MAEISVRLDEDLKNALKSSDSKKATILRTLKAALQNASIENKGELTDEEAMDVLQKEAKKRREAAEMYQKSGRDELAKSELNELEIITQYMPEQMTDDELGKIVDNVINDTGAKDMKDMGKVIGMVMSQVKGNADGSRVSGMVKTKLSS